VHYLELFAASTIQTLSLLVTWTLYWIYAVVASIVVLITISAFAATTQGILPAFVDLFLVVLL